MYYSNSEVNAGVSIDISVVYSIMKLGWLRDEERGK